MRQRATGPTRPLPQPAARDRAAPTLLLAGLGGLLMLMGGCEFSSTPKTTPPKAQPTPRPQPTARPTPAAPKVQNPFISVASRSQHSCGIRSAGDVLCWGKNTYGQLGNGGRVDTPRLSKVAGLTGVTQVEVGRDFSCALRRNGQVTCWGNNEDGQLGDGRGGSPGAMSLRPVVVSGLKRVKKISLGEYHGCALTSDGKVRCWGNAGNGQIGDDSQRVYGSPLSIQRLGKVVDLASGGNHVCALESSGKVKCWGRNTEGQLGDGKSGSRLKAVQVASITDGKAIASGDNHTCVLRRQGTAACWGANADGQLGTGARERKHKTPVALAGVPQIAQFAAGDRHTCVRQTSGRVLCWGANDRGQLGSAPSASPMPRAAPVRGMADAVDLSSGVQHTCAARATGEVVCWGNNEHGALGPQVLGAK